MLKSVFKCCYTLCKSLLLYVLLGLASLVTDPTQSPRLWIVEFKQDNWNSKSR